MQRAFEALVGALIEATAGLQGRAFEQRCYARFAGSGDADVNVTQSGFRPRYQADRYAPAIAGPINLKRAGGAQSRYIPEPFDEASPRRPARKRTAQGAAVHSRSCRRDCVIARALASLPSKSSVPVISIRPCAAAATDSSAPAPTSSQIAVRWPRGRILRPVRGSAAQTCRERVERVGEAAGRSTFAADILGDGGDAPCQPPVTP